MVWRGVIASPRIRRLGWPVASFVVLLALLVLRALELRLPGMARPFWQDEIHHNEPVVTSIDMAALDRRAMYRTMLQPKLDFWLRHELWFPTLGVNERAMRLPALIFGMALVLLVYGVLVGFFASRVRARFAPLLGFIATLWIVNNPLEIYYCTRGLP